MNYGQVAGKLKALGHPDRLRILEYLRDYQGVSVEAMAAALGLRQSTLSQHLHVLREAGLVTFEEADDGLFKERHYTVCFPELPAQLPALIGATS